MQVNNEHISPPNAYYDQAVGLFVDGELISAVIVYDIGTTNTHTIIPDSLC